MSHRKNRVAIVFPADALAAAGADVVSAPYADEIAQEIEARLADNRRWSLHCDAIDRARWGNLALLRSDDE